MICQNPKPNKTNRAAVDSDKWPQLGKFPREPGSPIQTATSAVFFVMTIPAFSLFLRTAQEPVPCGQVPSFRCAEDGGTSAVAPLSPRSVSPDWYTWHSAHLTPQSVLHRLCGVAVCL